MVNSFMLFSLVLKNYFDTVNHENGLNLAWTNSYIRTGNILSKSLIQSQFPRAGNLSLLLFILFVNTFTNVVTYTKLFLFADDVTIYLTRNHSLFVPYQSFICNGHNHLLHRIRYENVMNFNF